MELNNKRIAKNTVILYLRMMLMMLVMLYTSRVVLQVLGVTDLGIYNIVGGVVNLLAFVSNSMAISVQRFISFDLGNNNLQAASRTFSIALIVHVAIALVIFIIGETAGLYFLQHYINIPQDRSEAALYVYHFSLLATTFSIIQVVYNALIISFERMTIFAWLSVVDAILRLACIYALTLIDADKLVTYGGIMALVSLITLLAHVYYCSKKLQEIRFQKIWDQHLFQRLASFASWSALGEVAWAATQQGVNIVLNIFYGPVVNAARGIAYQVLGAVNRFTQSIQMAITPQIVKQYAANNHAEMLNLAYRGTRFSFFLVLLLILPIILKAEYILSLWLGEVPPHLVAFTQLVLINALLDSLSNLLTVVVKAYGRIKKYQATVSFLLMMNMPFSYILLKLGCSAESSFIVYAVISIILLAIRLLFTRKMVQASIRSYFKSVIAPSFLTLIFALPLPLFISWYSQNNITGFIVTTTAAILSIAFFIYTLGLQKEERLLLTNKISSIIHR